MQVIPKIKCKFGEGVGVEIFISHPNISQNNETFINTDYSSAVSSFAVDNGLKFGVDQYAVVSGGEKTEIVRTNASTAPTATTITLASATNYAHSRGESIQFIPYNQVTIQESTDGGTTYSTIATMALRLDAENTYLNWTTGLATSYYRARFKNSEDTTYSSYSDGIIATGFVASSAGSIIGEAMLELGEKEDDILSKRWLFNALNEGRREIDEDERIIRWEFRTVFGYNAYSIIPGQYKFTLPTNLREGDTNKNILDVRVGKNKYKCDYTDQAGFDQFYAGVRHTTLNGAVLTADTDIVLTESGDMDDSGSIVIAAQAVDEKLDTVDYDTAEIEETTIAFVEGGGSADTITDSGGGFLTAGFFDGQEITVTGSTSNDGTYRINTAIAGTLTLISSDDLVAEGASAEVKIVSTEANVVADNTLTGVTGIRAAGHATGTDVWKNATFGEPTYYTVDSKEILFSKPFSDNIAGETVELDYYKKITDINSDADLLDEPFYNIYVTYMRYKIKQRLDKNLDWKNDPDYIKWVQSKDAQINKQYNGQSLTLSFDLPC